MFTPLLASTSVGTLEYRCIVEPIRYHAKDVQVFEAVLSFQHHMISLDLMELIEMPSYRFRQEAYSMCFSIQRADV